MAVMDKDAFFFCHTVFWFHTGLNAPLHWCHFSDRMSFLLWLSERAGRIILAKHCRIWRTGFLEKKGIIWSWNVPFW